MPYRIETGTNYFEVYDISVLPNVRIINYPKKDTKFRIASATEVVFIGKGEKILMYEEGTQPPIPMVFDYTELQNGLLPFISFDALLVFLYQNTSGFSLSASTLPGAVINFQTARVIQNVSQFPIAAGEITSPDPVIHYIIDAQTLNLGELYFRVNDNQIVIISSLAPGGATLFSSEDNYNMIVGEGSLYLLDISITVGGLNSQVFDLQNTSVGRYLIYFDRVIFDSCVKLGTITNYQFVWQSGRVIICNSGITLDGAFSPSISIRQVGIESSNGILFEATPAYRCLDNAYIEQIRAVLAPTQTFISFIPANFPNDNSFFLKDNYISGSGTFATGITPSNAVCNWSSNHGNLAQNTSVGIFAVNQTNTLTPGVGVGTFTAMLGNFLFSRNDWFATDVNGGATYNSDTPRRLKIDATFSISGQVNVSYLIALRVTPTVGAPIIVQQMSLTPGTAIGGVIVTENNSFTAEYLFQQGDYIRPYFSKTAVSNDPTLLQYSTMRISD